MFSRSRDSSRAGNNTIFTHTTHTTPLSPKETTPTPTRHKETGRNCISIMALFSLIEPFSEFYIFVPIRLGWMDKSHNILDLLFYIHTYIK